MRLESELGDVLPCVRVGPEDPDRPHLGEPALTKPITPGQHTAAGPRPRFEHGHLISARHEAVRSGHSRQSRAEHDDAWRPIAVRSDARGRGVGLGRGIRVSRADARADRERSDRGRGHGLEEASSVN